MRNGTALAIVLATALAARAQGPAEAPDAVVFLGPLRDGAGAPSQAGMRTRVVLTNVAGSKAWRGVLDVLRARGFQEVVSFRGHRLERAFKELAKLDPGFVAVVVPPDTLDVNFHFDF
ncbi:MAG: hypothetical protein ACYS0K_17760, partial [Planctomycetota bacterium]